ncbi:ABC transporter ATP-binding protein [Paenibacillus sp. TRM 82003]|nr:ABC transporter ATP-binding protein [Paenibacillus sp. TRM 82003]
MGVLLEIKDLKLHLPTEAGLLKAVDGIDLTLERGKIVGVVGESGCGKSLAGKTLLGLHPKEGIRAGSALLHGDGGAASIDLAKQNPKGKIMRSVRGGRVAMIFQEPMTAFSPLHTIGDQIVEMIRLHRTKDKTEARRIAVEMLRKVGIPDAERKFEQYPHEFSGGMRQRAMIATALSCEPELLIADEPTTALDVTIQAQVLELMKRLQRELGMSILLITHDLGVVAEMCDEVAVMYLGKIVERAPARELFRDPKHPYTQGLLRSIPRLGATIDRLESIEGGVPVPIGLPPMCGFYERCPSRIEGVCDRREAPETAVAPGHSVRCFLHGGGEAGHEVAAGRASEGNGGIDAGKEAASHG